jgi:hypothetical protein
VRPYFVLQGNICALLAAKDHVNVFIYDPAVADPHGIINQGHGNATARAVQIYRGDAINRPALLAMFRAVIANNRAGGWRRLEASPPPVRAAQNRSPLISQPGRCAEMTMISAGTIGTVGCRLRQRQPGTQSPLGHGPKRGRGKRLTAQSGGSASVGCTAVAYCGASSAGPAVGAQLFRRRLWVRPRRTLPDGDDDLAFGVPFAQVAQRLGHLAERKAAIDDRSDLSRLAELDEGVQVLDAEPDS